VLSWITVVLIACVGIGTAASAVGCSHNPNDAFSASKPDGDDDDDDAGAVPSRPTAAVDGGVPAPLDGGTDAAVKPTCAAGTPFGAPVMLPNTNKDESGARYDATHTQMVFTRTGGAPSVLVTGTSFLDATTTPFGKIQGSNPMYYPSLSPDGLTLYYALIYGSNYDSSIFAATRATTSDQFANPVRITSSALDDYEPYVPQGAPAIYWSRYMPDSRWHFMRWPLATAGVLEEVLTSTSSGWMGNPVVSADEKTIYLSLDPGTSSSTNMDVYMATRGAANVPFGAPTRVDSLSTSNLDEAPTWISDDQCEIMIERYDTGGKISTYKATRAP